MRVLTDLGDGALATELTCQALVDGEHWSLERFFSNPGQVQMHFARRTKDPECSGRRLFRRLHESRQHLDKASEVLPDPLDRVGHILQRENLPSCECLRLTFFQL